MQHRIWTGAFSELEKRLLEDLVRHKAEDPLAPALVLVGSNILALYLRRAFADRGRGFANIRFFTFMDLVARLALPDRDASKRPILTPLGAHQVVDSLLRSDAPPAFQEVADLSGFRDALLDTFRDLRDAGVTKEDLEQGIRECRSLFPERTEHLMALLRLHEAFRRRTRHFRGVDEDFRNACSAANKARRLLGASRLFVYGIYDATGQQMELIEALSLRLDLTLFVPYVNPEVAGFARPFVENCARMLDVDAEPLVAEVPAGDLGELWRRDFGFGSAQPFPPSTDGSFRMVSAPGASRAAVEIVREVLTAVRDGIISGFWQAAVVLRHSEEEAPLLAEAFRLRGIPCYSSQGSSMALSPIGKAVVSLAGLEGASFARPSVLIAMELVCAALPGARAEEWCVPDWRFLTNTPEFLLGQKSWEDGTQHLVIRAERELARAASGSESSDGEGDGGIVSQDRAARQLEAARLLRAAWLRIKQAAGNWPAEAHWQEWADLLETRMRPLLGESAGWSDFSRAFDDLRGLGVVARESGMDSKVPRARFVSGLVSVLESLTIPEGKYQKNGVHLLSASAARGLRFPLIIIPGLEEGRFPARLRQDPLLLDEERRRIGRPSRLPIRALRVEEEKLLFDMAARSASKRLVLIASRLDEASEREKIPSEFFLRAASAVRGTAAGIRDLNSQTLQLFRSAGLDNPAPATGLAAVDEAEIRLRLVTAMPEAAQAALEAIAKEAPDLLARPMEWDRARWTKQLTEYDGRIRGREMLDWLTGRAGPGAGPVSPSRMEEYARCPYFFFLKRVIGIEGWEDQEVPYGLDPLERGTLYHAILERFLSRFAGRRFAEAAWEEMKANLLEVLTDAMRENRPPAIPDLLWELEAQQARNLLLDWLGFEQLRLPDGYLPQEFEWPFGPFPEGETNPALRIRAGKHEFLFRGRIDRVDFAPEGGRARVIDYKISRLPASMGARSRPLLMAGEKMQIPIYCAALAQSAPKLEIAGEYLHLQPRLCQTKAHRFNPAELRQAGHRLVSALEIIGDSIEKGIFLCRPGGAVREDNCEYCEYKPVCGREIAIRAERKMEDPDARAFAALQGLDPPVEQEP